MKRAYLFLILVLAIGIFQSCTETKAGEIQQITVEQMSEALKDSSIQFVDVRTGQEFLEGHLKNSHNICVTDDDFAEKAATIAAPMPEPPPVTMATFPASGKVKSMEAFCIPSS